MKLTDKHKQAFVNGLEEINAADFACPVCKKDDFIMLDKPVYLYDTAGGQYLNIGLMCVTCKYTLLFNASSLND